MMKKSMITLLAALMALGLISCSNNNAGTEPADTTAAVTTTEATTTEATETEAAAETTTEATDAAPENTTPASDAGIDESGTPLAILSTVWASYQEDEKFPPVGGDFSEANNNPNGPGRYDLSDAEAIDSMFGMPQASVAKLEDAASLMHMMNANTFTGSAFLVKDGEDVNAIAEEMHNNILSRQWMCGIPDKTVLFVIDNNIIAAFGERGIIDNFKSKLTAAYPDAVTAFESDITG